MPRPPKPGGAIFQPRRYVDNPRKFGRSGTRLISGPIESPQQAAAELQHAVANRIREHLLDTGMNLKAFSDRWDQPLPEGLTYERFQRANRGETMMALTDIMFWITQVPDLDRFIADKLRELSGNSSE